MSSDEHLLVSILNEIKELRKEIRELRIENKAQKEEFAIITEDTQLRIEQVLCLNPSTKPLRKSIKNNTDVKENKPEVKEKTILKKKKAIAINYWFSNMFVDNNELIKEFYTEDELKQANVIYEEDIKNKPPKKSKTQCREKSIAKIIWGQLLTKDVKNKLRTFKLNWENEQAKKENKDIVEDVN